MQAKLLCRDADALMKEDQAAEFLGFSTRAMQAWRYRGGGPRFVRISSRAIRYRRVDLCSWAEDRLKTSTSDSQQ
jgi:predicted DNA-binding transcriptional regulator AlpA